MKLEFNLKDKHMILIFLGVALLTVVSWFSWGYLLAGGEESFSYFSGRDPLSISWFWVERGTTGFLTSFEIVRLPIQILIHFAIEIGISPWFLQASIFSLLVFIGMYGVYELSKTLIEMKKRNYVALYAALFYYLNLFTMSQVLRRFIYAGIFTWAYLPIFLYFWIKYIYSGKLKYITVFLVTSLIFSPSFTHPAFLFVIWFPPVIYTIYRLIDEKEHQKRVIILIRTASLFLSWIIVNIWWIYLYLKLSFVSLNNSFSTNLGWESNLSSLEGVSKYFSAFDLLLLKQKFYFESFSYWDFEFYKTLPFYISAIFVLGVFFYGVRKYKGGKNYRYLLFLALFSWFISKGTSAPFGIHFFRFLFKNFSFMGMLRNSYEKFGSVWVLSYSIFFALGLHLLSLKFSIKYRIIFTAFVLFTACGTLVYPMWTGEIFSRGLKVKVPKHYTEMNDYINSLGEDGRILMLPIKRGYGITFMLGDREYSGTSPVRSFFDNTVLNFEFNNDKFIDLVEKYIGGEDIYKDLEELNIQYILLNEDYLTSEDLSDFPITLKKSEEILEEYSKIEYLKSFGSLSLYRYISADEYLGSPFSSDSDVVNIAYTKVNPTRYVLTISNTGKPFELVLKSTFNDLWVAESENTVFKHYKAHNYANGWKIDKEGDFEMEVYYSVWPWE